MALRLDEKKIIELYENISVPDIAKKANCSVTPIYDILKKYGVKINNKKHKKSWNNLQNNKNSQQLDYSSIIERYNMGESAKKIADSLKTKRYHIIYVLKANNISIRNLSEQFRFRDKDHFKKMSAMSVSSQKRKFFVSAPHKIVISFLEKRGINFKINQPINFYEVDILLDDNNIIEVNGDYWHANPTIYNEQNMNETQKKNVIRDKQKKIFLENRGYKILYLWENEIKNGTFVEKL